MDEYPDRAQKRKANLKQEKHCLSKADPDYSIHLVEYLRYQDNVVIITDFVAGCDMWELRQRYKADITEEEARTIILGLTKAVCSLTDDTRQIVHRDLHSKNVMIHFKELEPR